MGFGWEKKAVELMYCSPAHIVVYLIISKAVREDKSYFFTVTLNRFTETEFEECVSTEAEMMFLMRIIKAVLSVAGFVESEMVQHETSQEGGFKWRYGFQNHRDLQGA